MQGFFTNLQQEIVEMLQHKHAKCAGQDFRHRALP